MSRPIHRSYERDSQARELAKQGIGTIGGVGLQWLTTVERVSGKLLNQRLLLRQAGLTWYGEDFFKKLRGKMPWTNEEYDVLTRGRA
jgi:hypothetical protein